MKKKTEQDKINFAFDNIRYIFKALTDETETRTLSREEGLDIHGGTPKYPEEEIIPIMRPSIYGKAFYDNNGNMIDFIPYRDDITGKAVSQLYAYFQAFKRQRGA